MNLVAEGFTLKTSILTFPTSQEDAWQRIIILINLPPKVWNGNEMSQDKIVLQIMPKRVSGFYPEIAQKSSKQNNND